MVFLLAMWQYVQLKTLGQFVCKRMGSVSVQQLVSSVEEGRFELMKKGKNKVDLVFLTLK